MLNLAVELSLGVKISQPTSGLCLCQNINWHGKSRSNVIKLIRLLRSSCELNCRASLASFYLVINSVIFSSVPAKNAKKTIQQIPVLQLPVHLLVTTAISFRLPLSICNISQRPHHLLIHYSYVNCLAFLVKHFPNVIPKRASENQPPLVSNLPTVNAGLALA